MNHLTMLHEATQARLYSSPAERAREVLAAHWGDRVPVDPGAIARSLGIRLVPMGTLLTPFPYSGYFTRKDEEFEGPVIRYNRDEPAVRRRFTVAHEIGHFVLGHQDAPRDGAGNFRASVQDPVERAANQFAAELLMPSSRVAVAVNSGRFGSVQELADAFGVSSVAMDYRLTNLNLSIW